LRDYFIDVTRNANRIYSILATTVISGTGVTLTDTALGRHRSCSESNEIQPSIYSVLNSLESKYGKFTLTANSRDKVKHFAFRGTWAAPKWGTYHGFEEYRRWEFNDGNRSIILRCLIELDKKGPKWTYDEITNAYFVIELQYLDNMLLELVEKEKVFKEQWFQNESEKDKSQSDDSKNRKSSRDLDAPPEVTELDHMLL
jgi:hypothetical protein